MDVVSSETAWACQKTTIIKKRNIQNKTESAQQIFYKIKR